MMPGQEKHQIILESLANLTKKLIRNPRGSLDYQKMTDDLIQLAEAKYVALNTYEDDGSKIVTRAISGVADNILKASKLLGFNIKDKAWDVIPERANTIRNGSLVCFESLYEAASGAIPKNVTRLLEKTFKLGKVYVIAISHEEQFVGDFIIFMAPGKDIPCPELIEFYAVQAGVLLMQDWDFTRRKEAENELNKILNDYEIIFNGTQAAMFLVEVDDNNTFRFVRNNTAHQKATGLLTEHIKGKTPKELLGEEMGRSLSAKYSHCLRSAQPVTYEETLTLPGGTRTWHTSLTPVFDNGQKITNIVGSSIDITDRQAMEKALRKSEQYNRAIIEVIPDIIFRLAKDGTYLDVISSPRSKLYMPKEEMLGENLKDTLPAHIADKAVNLIKESLDSGSLKTFEYELQVPDGVNWFEARILPFGKDEVTTLIRDITEKKHQEKMLQESESRLNALISHTPAVIYSYKNVNGNIEITYINENVENILGYKPEDIMGDINYWKSLVHPEDLAGLKGKLKGEDQANEYRFKDVNGKYHWLYDQQKVINRTGQELEIIGAWWDITNRKHAEKKMNEYAAELELKGIELEELYHQLDEEMTKARKIHERTLPEALPTIKGISTAAHYQPAKRIGGDFYDVIKAGNKVIIYLSDVMGHGLDSAMLSVFVKNTINNFVSLSPEEKLKPSIIVDYLYQQYKKERYPEDYFVCIYMAVLDLENYSLTYTGCGFQFPPILATNNGERVPLTSEGAPLCYLFPREMLDFKEKCITLNPGDTLLLSSDGLFESEAGGEMYQSRGEEVFYKNRANTPKAIVQAINEDFSQFNQGSLEAEDDITFLVIQYVSEGRGN